MKNNTSDDLLFLQKGNESSSKIVRWVKSVRNGGSIYCRFPIKLVFSWTDPDSKIKTTFQLHKIPHYIIGTWGKEFIATPTGKNNYRLCRMKISLMKVTELLLLVNLISRKSLATQSMGRS